MLAKSGPHAIVTAADGSATVYSGEINGLLHSIRFDIGTMANTTDLVITGNTTGIAILTDSPAASETLYPRAYPNQVDDGAAEADARCLIPVVDEKLKVVVAQGGNVATGHITFFYQTV